MADVRDILEIDYPKASEINKDAIMGIKRDKKKKEKEGMKRPEGMHRELYALLYSSDGPKDLPTLIPTDADKGYKSVKAKLGMKKVRPWKWMSFTNPARSDGSKLYHWRRVCDEGKEYPFALFNKKIKILTYTDLEYSEHFLDSSWSRNETDTLFELCKRFDLRWTIIHDRWPSHLTSRSIEELKSKYYEVTNVLKKIRCLTGTEGKIVHYDADHEKRRKEQLMKLYDRTPKQIEEEQQLLAELRKIEARKKEREKKTQDLQKLISAADSSTVDQRKQRIVKKKLLPAKLPKIDVTQVPNIEASSSGIKFPDIKTSGVSLRSQKMKLPASVGQKKAKAIEQLLTELGLELNPIPTETICQKFNDLRSDLVLMYDLRTVLLNYVFELQTMKHQHESNFLGSTLEIPEELNVTSADDSPTKPRGISEVIDSVASPNTPNRKRRAAMEQSNVLKKIKART